MALRRITVNRLLEEQAENLGDREMVHFIDIGERMSYRLFNRRCNQLAHGLADRGIGAGSVVGVMLRNSLEYLLCTYALKKTGRSRSFTQYRFSWPFAGTNCQSHRQRRAHHLR